MFRRVTSFFALIVCALALGPGLAQAEPTVVDQYTEQVPDPGGEQPANELPPASGPDGSPAAGQTGGTDDPGTGAVAPSGTGGADGGSGPGETGGDPASAAQADTPAPASDSGSIDESSDSGGMGWLFPSILVACLVAAGVAVLIRRRGHQPRAT